MLVPGALAAVHSGTVRAADHFIPGATVTARQGTVKVVAYTDESGQYSLILTPGDWDVSIEMLGFTTQVVQVSGNNDTTTEVALEMPRIGELTPAPVEKSAPAPATTATSATTSTTTPK